MLGASVMKELKKNLEQYLIFIRFIGVGGSWDSNPFMAHHDKSTSQGIVEYKFIQSFKKTLFE